MLGLAITMIFAAPISTPSITRPAGVNVAVWVLRHICGDSPKRLNQPLCHPRHAVRCTKSESEPKDGPSLGEAEAASWRQSPPWGQGDDVIETRQPAEGSTRRRSRMRERRPLWRDRFSCVARFQDITRRSKLHPPSDRVFLGPGSALLRPIESLLEMTCINTLRHGRVNFP